MKRWGFRAFRKDVGSEWHWLWCCSFQVVSTVIEKDPWLKVFVETRGAVRIRESVDERRGWARTQGLRHSERYVGVVSVKLKQRVRFCIGYKLCAMFLCFSYHRLWGLHFYDRWIWYGIFNVHTNLGACCTHKGGSGTNQSAQELTRRDRNTDPYPAQPGDQTQGLQIWILTLTTELHPDHTLLSLTRRFEDGERWRSLTAGASAMAPQPPSVTGWASECMSDNTHVDNKLFICRLFIFH